MEKKIYGIALQILGLAVITVCSILLPRYENITIVAVWMGAFGGVLIAYGSFYRKHGMF
ncbi:MAG: hypothetical protein SCH39_00335 [Methanosarcinales archaeon]|nr:hypothetical protein [Methanosarcinales archaeon]